MKSEKNTFTLICLNCEYREKVKKLIKVEKLAALLGQNDIGNLDSCK
jgi:hypothetical protein